METTLGMLIPLTFFAMLALEHVFPGRALPKVSGWLPKGIAFFFLTAAVNGALPALFAERIAAYAPIHLASVGTPLSVFVAFFVTDFVSYWVHRLMHNVHFIWRWSHQMHHSAERVDMAGAAYFHPFDMLITVGMTTVVTSLLGMSPLAAAITGLAGFVWGVFQHMNVRTPTWLGYLIQRPEAHAVHHARGVHAYNYGNIPIWDLLFGTFRNPAKFTELAGFYDGGSKRLGAMLLGRDIGTPPPASPSPQVGTSEAQLAS